MRSISAAPQDEDRKPPGARDAEREPHGALTLPAARSASQEAASSK